MTPLQIEMLLHYNASPGPFTPWGDAQHEAIQLFFREGLIRAPWSLDSVQLTERGKAYIRLLQLMPLPTSTWSLPGPWNPTLPPST